MQSRLFSQDPLRRNPGPPVKAAPTPLPLQREIHSASSFLIWWNSSKHTLCSYFLLRNPPALWNRLLAGCMEFELGKLWAAAALEKGLEATLRGRALGAQLALTMPTMPRRLRGKPGCVLLDG